MLEVSSTGVSCTVVICTRDRPAQLERCLEAISRLHSHEMDVLVVDNASHDGRSKEVAQRRGARYCFEPNPGLSRARNRGARESRGEIIAYLDDDSTCEQDWLSALLIEFADPRVMAVTGRVALTTADGTVSRHRQDTDERRVVDRTTSNWFEIANFGGLGNGGNMAFRRQAFDLWPGFDERLGRGALLWGGEEHYAFFSLIDRGYRVVYTPSALVMHPYPVTQEDLRVRYRKSIAAVTGYMTLLLVEEPRYRQQTIKYIVAGIRKVERTWRHSTCYDYQAYPRIVPAWEKMLAYLSGPILYARSCWQSRGRLKV